MTYRSVVNFLNRIMFPLLFCGLVGYFGYHAFYGKRGVFSWLQVNSKLTNLNTKLAALKQENDSLENRVNRLRSNSLDPDLLDEQIRKVLGWNGKDEVVIVDPSYNF